MRRHALVIVVVGLLVAADKPKSDAPSDKDRLQGTWQVVSREGEGKKEPAEFSKHFTYTFKGNTIRFLGKDLPGADLEYSYTLEPTKKPKAIDMKLTKAPDKKGVGHVDKGIYSLEGDELKICFSDKERPTRFATKAKEHITLVILKRKK